MAYAFSDTKMAPSVVSAGGPRGHGPAPWRVLGRLAAACAAAEPGRGEQRESERERELLRAQRSGERASLSSMRPASKPCLNEVPTKDGPSAVRRGCVCRPDVESAVFRRKL